jgi:hypothetical protein
MVQGPTGVDHWLVDDQVTSYAVAGCVTIGCGLTKQEALALIAADVDRPHTASVEPRGDELGWVAFASAEHGLPEGTVVLIEDNGWQLGRLAL